LIIKRILIGIFLGLFIPSQTWGWEPTEYIDQITDEKRLSIYQNESSSRFDGLGRAALWIRCQLDKDGKPKQKTFFNGQTFNDSQEILIVFTWPTISVELVETRIDKGSVQRRDFSMSTNNQAIFLEDKEQFFLKDLLWGKKLTIRTHSKYQRNKTFLFDLSELSKEIEPLATACGWKIE